MDSVDNNKFATFESLGLTQPKQKAADQQPKLGQEDFMKLMLTQMNHQDPFKPMEDGEFLTQMAQFSAVKGLKDIKDSFSTLTESMKSNQALQASSMVGRRVLVPGDVAKLPERGELRGAIDLPASSPELKIKIHDNKGQLVHTIDMGEQKQGMVDFNWDGTIKVDESDAGKDIMKQLDAGDYTIRAESVVDGEPQALKTLVVDAVESVSLGGNGQGVTLNLANGGTTSMSTVKQIF